MVGAVVILILAVALGAVSPPEGVLMPNDVVRISFFARWRNHPLTLITALLAVVYGLGFAFEWWGPEKPAVFYGGAVLCLALFTASLIAAARKR